MGIGKMFSNSSANYFNVATKLEGNIYNLHIPQKNLSTDRIKI